MTDALSEYDCNAWRTRLDTLMHDATLATTLRWEQEIRALATIDRLRAVNAKLLAALENIEEICDSAGLHGVKHVAQDAIKEANK